MLSAFSDDNGVFNLEWRNWWLAFVNQCKNYGACCDQRNPNAYREYFDDGDSPRDAALAELRGTLKKEG